MRTSFSDYEIRMIGHPVKFTVPGTSTLKARYLPDLKGGKTYNGFVMGVSDCGVYANNLCLDIDDQLVKFVLYNYPYDINDYIIYNQKEATYENLRNICILLYNKISELEERLNNV